MTMNDYRLSLGRRAIAAAAMVLLTNGAALAETLATGPLYGGSNTYYVSCSLYNPSATSISGYKITIRGELGTVYFSGDCNGYAINENFACVINLHLRYDEVYSCTATTPKNSPNVVGVMQIFDSNGAPLATSNLIPVP